MLRPINYNKNKNKNKNFNKMVGLRVHGNLKFKFTVIAHFTENKT